MTSWLDQIGLWFRIGIALVVTTLLSFVAAVVLIALWESRPWRRNQ